MKRTALQKARDRLRVAEDAFERMKKTEIGSDEFDHLWYNFLVSQNSVFSSLEQGAKEASPSKGWFDRKKHERKTDPLLKYLMQARHSDEHSLRPSIVRRSRLGAVSNSPGTLVTPPGGSKTGKLNIRIKVGMDTSVQLLPPGEFLVPVFDRNKNRYDPPGTHLGKPMEHRSPMAVADLCVQYLRKMISEAEALAASN
jgi:hypothetical protein